MTKLMTPACTAPDITTSPASNRQALQNRRNAGIDCLRGLAILFVIVHHLALPFRLPLGPSLLGSWWPKRLIDAVSFSGYEAVFIFFVTSGFLITTRIVEHDGDLERVDLRRFYRARAQRILPLLIVVLGLLTLLAWFGVPGFAPGADKQTIGGLLGSALTLTFNWYEGRTGWAPAAWDVLWSLSIEEVFYLGFPLLCRWLPRRLLIAALLAWALSLVPVRNLVLASDEVWWEKAYLPGMAAIAWGVLAALLAQRWRPSLRDARALAPPVLSRGFGWRARMGALSYELYLSHMFVVLAAVAIYRRLLGNDRGWTFAVYLPVLAVCYVVAGVLGNLFGPRGAGRHSARQG